MATVTAINNLGSHAHNPRGNLWFNDESTYGHKLLMKMGWSHGKGLGKNEDGIKENLSVKFRNTNSGLGFKDDPYANIMKTEYELILKDLNDTYSPNEASPEEKNVEEQENKNYEQKSRVVKSRVRYPKLFFGKDVSKYSEKDMKSIFICSLPSKDKEETCEDSATSNSVKSENELLKPVETKSSTLSISEYFAKKMKEKKNNALKEKANDNPNQLESRLDTEINQDVLSSKKMNKKRKKNVEINSYTNPVNDSKLQQAALEFELGGTDDLTNQSCQKSSSSKKRKKCSDTNICEVGRNFLNIDGRDSELIVPKKKKQKLSHLSCTDDVSEIQEIENSNSCALNKKQKKSKVYENGHSLSEKVKNDNHEGKIYCQIELSSNAVLELNKKRSKKHKNKSKNTVELVENFHVTDNDDSSGNTKEMPSNSEPASSNKKKHKKMKLKKLKSCLKSKRGSYSMKNVSFNESVSYRVIDADFESVDPLSGAFSVLPNNLPCEIDQVPEENKNYSSVDQSTALEGCVQTCGDDSVFNSQERVLEESFNDEECDSDSVPDKQDTVSESEDGCSLSGLPSPKSPHYNYWVESQRLALKMKMYKTMLKNIKKHDVLGTTNLLSIKGYGNWGF